MNIIFVSFYTIGRALQLLRCPGYVFDSLVEPLRYIFSNSLAQEIFLEEMKIARITPIYKGGDKENIVKL